MRGFRKEVLQVGDQRAARANLDSVWGVLFDEKGVFLGAVSLALFPFLLAACAIANSLLDVFDELDLLDVALLLVVGTACGFELIDLRFLLLPELVNAFFKLLFPRLHVRNIRA